MKKVIAMMISSAIFMSASTLPMMHHKMDKNSISDSRISLNYPPAMKQEQLSNMRSHLQAIQSIIHLISKKEFDTASKIASKKLGLTPDMKQMCGMIDNDKFKMLGMNFHKSGDTLAKKLKTKNLTQILPALSNTLSYCVRCHAAFKQ